MPAVTIEYEVRARWKTGNEFRFVFQDRSTARGEEKRLQQNPSIVWTEVSKLEVTRHVKHRREWTRPVDELSTVTEDALSRSLVISDVLRARHAGEISFVVALQRLRLLGMDESDALKALAPTFDQDVS